MVDGLRIAPLCLWFYAIGDLPLATAMTLNDMSSVWMAVAGMMLIAAAGLSATLRRDRGSITARGDPPHTV